MSASLNSAGKVFVRESEEGIGTRNDDGAILVTDRR